MMEGSERGGGREDVQDIVDFRSTSCTTRLGLLELLTALIPLHFVFLLI